MTNKPTAVKLMETVLMMLIVLTKYASIYLHLMSRVEKNMFISKCCEHYFLVLLSFYFDCIISISFCIISLVLKDFFASSVFGAKNS